MIFPSRLFFSWCILLVIATMPLKVVYAESGDAVPKDLLKQNNEFIQYLNSGDMAMMGTLMMPDISKEEALRIFRKSNPSLNSSSSPPTVLPDDSKYSVYGFTKVSSNVWIAQYGRWPIEDVNAVWVVNAKLWCLKGWGWHTLFAKEQALQYINGNGLVKPEDSPSHE